MPVPSGAPNSHIAEYLKYYASFKHAPNYAVLINGPWGIGKTHFVKKFLGSHFADPPEEKSPTRSFRLSRIPKSPEKYVYVSLYGLSSADEIDGVLLASIYPILGFKAAKLTGRVAKTILKHNHLDIDLKGSDFLTKSNGKLYVFDDLERCRLDVNAVLGYINQFIEHGGCRVVIIANEKEIKADGYSQRREKVVGKTLEFESVLSEALAHFVSQIDDQKTRQYLDTNREAIVTIYNQSSLDNLRILQQSLWDFERLFRALSSHHRSNEHAMAVLLRLFLALSFETKAGRLKIEDLRHRISGIVVGQVTKADKDRKFARLAEAVERYPTASLSDEILSDEILVNLLVRGLVRPTEIAESLDQSRYYARRENEPAWRVLWHGLELFDEDFEKAFTEVERQFAAREFTIIGEILHVLGIRLWLADAGLLAKSRSEIVKEGKAYIDDIYERRLLEPLPLEPRWDDMTTSAYGGLGYSQADSVEYKELFDYLRERRERASADRLPERLSALLMELRFDPDLYYRRVCHTNSSDNVYWRTPILAAIKPEEFTEIVLQQDPSAQRIILAAFKSRYQHGGLNGELAAEKDWLAAVRTLLIEKSRAMSKISQYRTARFIEWYVAPVFQEK